MFTIINNILTEKHITEIQVALDSSPYTPGTDTAGKSAANVKHNLQSFNPIAANIVVSTLLNNKDFQRATYIKNIIPPIFSLHTEGMEYGPHIDDAVMSGAGYRLRCHLAMTVFLNSPEEYEGGELCINIGQPNETRHKLGIGSMIIYPANTRHCVLPITVGFRKAAVTWGQSCIRDHTQREILHDLLEAADETSNYQIEGVHSKLVRMWADV
jgi:PKHD-type hydroxylase